MGLALGVLAVVVAAAIAMVASHVLVLVVISILLAASIDPLVDRVRQHVPLSRGATILTVYGLLVAASILLVVLVVPAAMDQMDSFSARLPLLLDDVKAWAEAARPAFISDAVGRVATSIEANLARAELETVDSDTVVTVGITLVEGVVTVITLLSLTFFWLVSREPMQRFLLAVLPLGYRAGVRDGWNNVEQRLGLWMRGQLTLMAFIGVVTTIAYVLLGLENALLLGLIAGIAEIIPIVGPAIGAIPALISAVITGGPELALLVAGVYVVIQLVEGHVLVPMVMRNAVGLPPYVVIVSLLIGAAVGGLIGALLAVPAAAALVVVLERVQSRDEPVSISPTSSTSALDQRPDEPTVVGGRSEGSAKS
jgi:predicted PurR-regulated permease PerM